MTLVEIINVLIWTVLSLLNVIWSSSNWRSAEQNLKVANRIYNPKDAKRLLVKGARNSLRLMALVQYIFFSIGVTVMVLEPGHPIRNFIVSYGLMLAQVLFTLKIHGQYKTEKLLSKETIKE